MGAVLVEHGRKNSTMNNVLIHEGGIGMMSRSRQLARRSRETSRGTTARKRWDYITGWRLSAESDASYRWSAQVLFRNFNLTLKGTGRPAVKNIRVLDRHVGYGALLAERGAG